MHTRLSRLEIAEIYYLGNTGCPCCGVPLPLTVLAKAYNTSSSTVSRIVRDIVDIPDDLKLDRQGLVELRKQVIERGGPMPSARPGARRSRVAEQNGAG